MDLKLILIGEEVNSSEVSIGFQAHFGEVDEPQTSPWANGRFRVLVGTHCACLYCVTFWGYSVFPMLINEQGPSLELISFFYSLEGAAQDRFFF